MPIYAYQCQSCGHDFDVMQKMSDPAPGACPACGKGEIRKQLSAAGFQLKGSGWYASDFKGKAKSNGDKKDSDSADSGSKAAGSCGSGGCGSCSTH